MLLVNFPFSITARIILLSVRYPFIHRHFKQKRILYSVDGDFDSHRFISDVIGYKEKNNKAFMYMCFILLSLNRLFCQA
jgi:hypothetical protein